MQIAPSLQSLFLKEISNCIKGRWLKWNLGKSEVMLVGIVKHTDDLATSHLTPHWKDLSPDGQTDPQPKNTPGFLAAVGQKDSHKKCFPSFKASQKTLLYQTHTWPMFHTMVMFRLGYCNLLHLAISFKYLKSFKYSRTQQLISSIIPTSKAHHPGVLIITLAPLRLLVQIQISSNCVYLPVPLWNLAKQPQSASPSETMFFCI